MAKSIPPTSSMHDYRQPAMAAHRPYTPSYTAPPRRGPIGRLFTFFGRLFRLFLATGVSMALIIFGSYWLVKHLVSGQELLAPNVMGLTPLEALKQIGPEKLSLQWDSEQPHDAVRQGQIISQFPSPGSRIKAGTPIRVVTSAGTPLVTVPDLVNRPKRQARQVLQELGLEIGNITSNNESNAAAGLILQTDPPAGTGVPQGTAINLMISASGQAAQSMPNLQGLDLATARERLTQLGLDISEERQDHADGVPPGQIHLQYPAPGESVTETTRIIVSYEPASTEPAKPAPSDPSVPSVDLDHLGGDSATSEKPAVPTDGDSTGTDSTSPSREGDESTMSDDMSDSAQSTPNTAPPAGGDSQDSSFYRNGNEKPGE